MRVPAQKWRGIPCERGYLRRGKPFQKIFLARLFQLDFSIVFHYG